MANTIKKVGKCCANGKTGEKKKSKRRKGMAGKNYNKRRWSIPSKRAKGYAQDRRERQHTYGDKEGEPLTDFEAGIRSGYLQCQNDHAGMYKYMKAIGEGKSPAEAAELSLVKGKAKAATSKKGGKKTA